MSDPAAGHTPVLADAVFTLLDPQPGQTVLDCTLGRAGHAGLLASRLGAAGTLIGLDMDEANLAYARDRLADAPCRIELRHANFAEAPGIVRALGIAGVDMLLADLGFASNQMADPARGLSFAADGPLDMRLDVSLPRTAADLVATLDERELADVIYEYGEERLSRKIARKIVAEREKSPILTTMDLARLVRAAYGRAGRSRIDPATRTFMALRIAVNDELGSLKRLLESLPRLLNPGGRAALISFHSLEDRLVKQCFVAMERDGQGERLTRKPITATDAERYANPRSRSAKLRALRWATGG